MVRASLKRKPEPRRTSGALQRTLVVGVVKSCDLVGGLGNKATVRIAWTSQYVITSHPLDIVGATHCRRERRACGRVPPDKHTHDRGTRPKSKVELFKRGEGYKSKKGILEYTL